jgi:hypothetical protein
MTMIEERKDEPKALSADIGHRDEEPHPQEDLPHYMRVENYGGGEVQARHGRVNAWLAVVYAVLFIWGLSYGYIYWGGLGTGLNY